MFQKFLTHPDLKNVCTLATSEITTETTAEEISKTALQPLTHGLVTINDRRQRILKIPDTLLRRISQNPSKFRYFPHFANSGSEKAGNITL